MPDVNHQYTTYNYFTVVDRFCLMFSLKTVFDFLPSLVYGPCNCLSVASKLLNCLPFTKKTEIIGKTFFINHFNVKFPGTVDHLKVIFHLIKRDWDYNFISIGEHQHQIRSFIIIVCCCSFESCVPIVSFEFHASNLFQLLFKSADLSM